MKMLNGSCRNNRVVSIKVQKQILFSKTVIELVCNPCGGKVIWLASFRVAWNSKLENQNIASARKM
jgi:hypothetical protein